MIRASIFIFLTTALVLTGCASDSNVSAIRERLLSATPIGSDATNVLKYVVDDFRPKKGVLAYYKYVDALESARRARLDVGSVGLNPPAIPKPSDWPPNEGWPPRDIYVWISSYMNGNRLFATWTFDTNDKLLRVYVGRDMTP